MTPSGTAAASSNVMPVGLRASGALSGRQTNSAWAPAVLALTPKTWSPTSNSVTAGPTASTSPASSVPGIFRFGRRRPVRKAADEVLGAAETRIRPIDRRGVDLDEDFVVLGYGPLDLFEPQNLGRPVPFVDDRFHSVRLFQVAISTRHPTIRLFAQIGFSRPKGRRSSRGAIPEKLLR
jgi:hypothetical protein